MSNNNFDNLLTAYLENDISEQQVTELHSIIQSSNSAKQRFQDETRLHIFLREIHAEQLELHQMQNTPLPVAKRAPRLWAYAAAAILIISSIITFIVFRPNNDPLPQIGACMSISGNGGLSIQRNTKSFRATTDTPLAVGDQLSCDPQTQAMLRLADGSILAMEPNTTITLVSNRPEIRLQKGQVFFEVAPRQPNASTFQVLTEQSTIDVIGTVFSLAANDHTELKVYEGAVTLTRRRDNASINVESQHMTTTAEKTLTTKKMTASAPSTKLLYLTPTDDLNLENGKPNTDLNLKVEKNRRTIYLRFDLPAVGPIQSTKIKLTQNIDPGRGTLRFFLGSHANWTENTLTGKIAPKPQQPIGKHTGVIRRGQTIEVDLHNVITQPGPTTIIITLDKKDENDIWFASRETTTPPQLILTYLPSN